jgi:hypothetical protein
MRPPVARVCQRRRQHSADFLRFSQKGAVRTDFAVPHEFEPTDGFVRLFHSGSEFCDEFCPRASPLCGTVIGPGGGRRFVELHTRNLRIGAFCQLPIESKRRERESVCAPDELRWLPHDKMQCTTAATPSERVCERHHRVSVERLHFLRAFLLSTFYFSLFTFYLHDPP